MELGQVIEQRLTVTPQLIVANTLLQLSAGDLEQAISRELAENPFLERLDEPSSRPAWAVKASEGWRGEEPADDALALLPAIPTLEDYLLQQAQHCLPSHDLPIATCLLNNLDEHGLLRCSLDEVAAQLSVSQEQVSRVLAVLQELEPVGIAARDVRECLLIQLAHLRRQGMEHALAQTLIAEHWESLGRRSPTEIARIVGAAPEQVQEALRFIRENLTPYPAYAYWADPERLHAETDPSSIPVPDLIIRRSQRPGAEYEVELPGEQAFRLRVNSLHTGEEADGQEEQWLLLHDRARLFVHSLEQRWRTLRRLAHILIEMQRPFLVQGERGLRPLTRARVAEIMGVHESTVSRAVAGKYAQLPDGRIVPLARFFEGAAAVKAAIQEMIAQEGKPLSDREIADRLVQQGYCIARRTVAKYRDALHIPPAPLRLRRHDVGSHRKKAVGA
jgi:RNA polymerase sigma-54 factor